MGFDTTSRGSLAAPTLGRRLRERCCRGVLVAQVAYEAGARWREHSHQRASLTLVVSGSFTERIDGVLRHSRSLTVIYKPAGAVHSTEVGPVAAHSINLSLPGHTGLDGAPPLVALGGPLVAPILELAQAAEEPFAATARRIDRCLAELLCWSAGAAALTPEPDPLVERARASMLHGLTVREVARRGGTDPATLWRRFRRSSGAPPTVWRRRARVAEAARRLSEAGDALSAIAVDCGFSDQAHLTRCFRRETGVTPAQFRLLATRVAAG